MPDKILLKMPEEGKYLIWSLAIDAEVARVSAEGLRIIKPFSGTAAEAKVIYKSADIVTDLQSGKGGYLTLYEDSQGKVFAAVGGLDDWFTSLPPALGEDIGNINSDLAKYIQRTGQEGVGAWEALHRFNPNSFIKRDAARLEVFQKLSSENRNLLMQFTDVDANSTLAKFLDDCKADPEFLSHINNPDNILEVKGFLAHKEGMLAADENFLIAEILENSDEIPNSKVRKWLEYGDNMTAFKANREAGNTFGNLMKTQLVDATSEAYRALKHKVPNLDEYTIYSQVQLCLNGNCIKKGEYWIPDFILVAERSDAITRTKYLEVMIVDAKLSGSTGWTPNQHVAKGMNGWKVKSIGDNALVKGNKISSFDLSSNVSKKGEFIKLYKEGGTVKAN